MIVVTGGAGFIGSNLVKALGADARAEILVVDDMSDGKKFRNLVDCEVAAYWDKGKFIDHVRRGCDFEAPLEAIFHQGACSDTTEWDGRYMMETNFEYSCELFEYCTRREIPFFYASSASVYGSGPIYREEREHESPLNLYAFSKCLFDRYVRRRLPKVGTQVVGLRYFNVYGPHEAHKGRMASVAYQLRSQLLTNGKLCLFEGSDGYDAGEQRRDFVYVDDVVSVNLWFLGHRGHSGIFNVGTGRSHTFNEVARAIIDWYGSGEVEYTPFPSDLEGCYQSFTEADVSRLRACGYDRAFAPVSEAIPRYMEILDREGARRGRAGSR